MLLLSIENLAYSAGHRVFHSSEIRMALGFGATDYLTRRELVDRGEIPGGAISLLHFHQTRMLLGPSISPTGGLISAWSHFGIRESIDFYFLFVGSPWLYNEK